jgi:Straboviridae homing endonuclease
MVKRYRRKLLTHRHHIVPRHMGGSDDPSNLIEVTIERHAGFHTELWNEFGRWQDLVAWKSLSKQITCEEARRLASSFASKGKPCQWLGKKRPAHAEFMREYRKKHKVWNAGVFGCWNVKELENFRQKALGENNAMYGRKGANHPGYGHIGSLAPKVVCPHCNKTLDKGNAARWHFNKCSERKSLPRYRFAA